MKKTTTAGTRWKGLRGYWGSNTVTGAVPEALGKPILKREIQEQMAKKDRLDNGSG